MKNNKNDKKKKKSKNDLLIAFGVLIFIIFFKLALVYQNSQEDNFNLGSFVETPVAEESEIVEESEVLLDVFNDLLFGMDFWTLLFIFTGIYFFFGIIYRFLRTSDLV